MNTLEELCRELRNWFVVDRGMIFGRFTIADGVITPINLQFGQYYRIIGSVFNDGLHRFDEQDTLVDEQFNGAIWLLAIPPAVQQLATEIEDYKQMYEKEASPYASESFGGYSYQKAAGKDGEPIGWRAVFSDRLKAWRKI